MSWPVESSPKYHDAKWQFEPSGAVRIGVRMLKRKTVVRWLLALMFTTSTTLSVGFTGEPSSMLRAQGQEGPERVRNWKVLNPVDEASEPAETHKQALRQSKNRRYNSARSDQLLTEQPPEVVYGRIDESRRPSAMPISQSDAVILGTVVGAQPYLAEDKKSIYTELSIHVEEVFKNEVPAFMTSENLMVVDHEGGALRLKNGRVLRYLVGGITRLPNTNGRYLFFLSLTHNGQDLSVLSGYELRNGSVMSLEDGADKLPYANWNEPNFLNEVRSADSMTRSGRGLRLLVRRRVPHLFDTEYCSARHSSYSPKRVLKS